MHNANGWLMHNNSDKCTRERLIHPDYSQMIKTSEVRYLHCITAANEKQILEKEEKVFFFLCNLN